MCGRYVQSKRARDYARIMGARISAVEPRPPTWNLAPSTQSLVVRREGEDLAIAWPEWGFGNGKLRPINARLETVAQKSYFRDAWKAQRCVVPVDGWYEWKLERGRKQPYYFQRTDGEPMFFGALWWRETFTLLTVATEGHLSVIHHRRPLSVRTSEARSWLENPVTPKMAQSYSVPEADIRFHPVDRKVSSARNEGPELILEAKGDVEPANLELQLFRDDDV